MPESGTVYVASFAALEADAGIQALCGRFGGLPAQAGYCCGYNTVTASLEYHKSPEVLVALTPLVLVLGLPDRWQDGGLAGSQLEAFYLDAGDVVEVLSNIWHFAPCQVADSGFRSVIILPAGTNLDLDQPPADPLLFRKNKWLITHTGNQATINKGVQPLLTGDVVDIRY